MTRSVGLGWLDGKCLLDLEGEKKTSQSFDVWGVYCAVIHAEEWLMLALDGLCWGQRRSFPAPSK